MTKLTRDEALMALNDFCGFEVEVNVEVASGDTTLTPMTVKGVLRHWGEDRKPGESVEDALVRSLDRGDLTGLYDLGASPEATSLDVRDLDTARLLADDDERPYGIEFSTAAGGVTVVVTWGIEPLERVGV